MQREKNGSKLKSCRKSNFEVLKYSTRLKRLHLHTEKRECRGQRDENEIDRRAGGMANRLHTRFHAFSVSISYYTGLGQCWWSVWSWRAECSINPAILHNAATQVKTRTHKLNIQQRSTAKIEGSCGNYTPNKSVIHSFLYVCTHCVPSPLP